MSVGRVPGAYDAAAFAAGRRAVQRWSTVGDVHAPVAERLRAEGLAPVLDVGCGDGELSRHGVAGWIGLDVRRSLGATVVGDAASLPVADGSCGAVVALWSLYHLEQPEVAVAEAHRVLHPEGLFAACTTSRADSPELHAWFDPPEPTTFDAEEAPAIIGSIFGDTVEVEAWDGPFIRLPDRAAVAEYLLGRGASSDRAAEVAAEVPLPFTITKRGVLVWARRLH